MDRSASVALPLLPTPMVKPTTARRFALLTAGSLALLSACSDGDRLYDEPAGTAGFGVGGAAGGAGCADCPVEDGGSGGGGPVDPPDPTEPSVCYPGPLGDYTSCAALVPWSEGWGSDYDYPEHDSAQYLRPSRFVDLSAIDPALAIGEHFALDEVMQEVKGRYGLFQAHVVDKLEAIRELTGGPLHLNSAYRSPAYNASVGGVTYSRHMYGDAADMWSSEVSLTALGDICHQLGAGYVGLYDTFVHCDWRDDPLDPAFFDTLEPTVGELPWHTAELVRRASGSGWRAPATGFDEGEPLRIWTAIDAAGNVVGEAEGASYEPPAAAVRLRVVVGGQVELDVRLED